MKAMVRSSARSDVNSASGVLLAAADWSLVLEDLIEEFGALPPVLRVDDANSAAASLSGARGPATLRRVAHSAKK